MVGSNVCIRRAAPSRERGSKQGNVGPVRRRKGGRSLTGARIETPMSAHPSVHSAAAPSRERGSKRSRAGADQSDDRPLPHGSADRNSNQVVEARLKLGRSLTGARIETPRIEGPGRCCPSRSLTGARIETTPPRRSPRCDRAAPSRERGSKPLPHRALVGLDGPLPHGSADRNMPSQTCLRPSSGRSLTGARIET